MGLFWNDPGAGWVKIPAAWDPTFNLIARLTQG